MFLYQENISKHVLKCAVLGSTTLVPTYHVCEAGVKKADYTHNVQFWKARLKLWNFQNPHKTHHTTSGQYCKNNNIIIIWVMLEKESASKEFFLKKT